jgi:microcystin degradation protein MlrC
MLKREAFCFCACCIRGLLRAAQAGDRGDAIEVRKRYFCEPFYTENASFYQDRLGTNIGKPLKHEASGIDSPVVGASAIVVADGLAADPSAAQDAANTLGKWLWERKDDWVNPPLSAEAALGQGEGVGRYPIVLADQGDNPGGGAPSDTTEVLRLFKERALSPAAVLYICDPEAAKQAHDAGAGAVVPLDVGGKSHPRFGPPVHFDAAGIVAVSDGRFVYDGPMYKDKQEDLGPCAHIEQGGLHVVIVSLPVQPMDLALCRSLDLDCTALRYICVKSTGHFRSGFEPIAGSIYNIDTLSLLPQDWAKIDYSRLGRSLFPLDAAAEFQPMAAAVASEVAAAAAAAARL